MNLNPELIAAYKEILTNPSKHKIDLAPLEECFLKSEEVTACHIMYQQYKEYIGNRPLPKVVFYIILEEIYGRVNGQDEKGNNGYHLTFTKG